MCCVLCVLQEGPAWVSGQLRAMGTLAMATYTPLQAAGVMRGPLAEQSDVQREGTTYKLIPILDPVALIAALEAGEAA